MSAPRFTLLEVVKACNNSPDVSSLVSSGEYYRLFADNGVHVGLVHVRDVPPLESECAKQTHPVFEFDHAEQTISFNKTYKTEQQRTSALALLLNELRASDAWPSLRQWRNELFPICCGKANTPSAMVERAATSSLGMRTFGVDIIGFVKSLEDGKLCMWVAKRAQTKKLWPGFFDNLAAGGIGNGDGVFESMLKECAEEAGIPADIAAKAQSSGTVQYIVRSELGLQPETQYMFDLELPADFTPRPNDGEVEDFYLWTVDEVLEGIHAGLFKPHCALGVIDFMIRRGIITAENESDYLEIIDNIHVKLPFPGN